MDDALMMEWVNGLVVLFVSIIAIGGTIWGVLKWKIQKSIEASNSKLITKHDFERITERLKVIESKITDIEEQFERHQNETKEDVRVLYRSVGRLDARTDQ